MSTMSHDIDLMSNQMNLSVRNNDRGRNYVREGELKTEGEIMTEREKLCLRGREKE